MASERGWQDETLDDLLASARHIVSQTEAGCSCVDEPHQNALHDLAFDVVRVLSEG